QPVVGADPAADGDTSGGAVPARAGGRGARLARLHRADPYGDRLHAGPGPRGRAAGDDRLLSRGRGAPPLRGRGRRGLPEPPTTRSSVSRNPSRLNRAARSHASLYLGVAEKAGTARTPRVGRDRRATTPGSTRRSSRTCLSRATCRSTLSYRPLTRASARPK